MFDTHTHLVHRSFRKDRKKVFDRAIETGVTRMLEVGWDLDSSENALKFAENHPEVWTAIGIHPHDARNTPKNYLQKLEEFSKQEQVKAIGEIGLDYYRDLSPRDVQRKVFVEQIELAEELNLPLVVHCREAMEDCLQIVAERGYYWGVFHSAAANTSQAMQIAELGFYLGINGTITYDGRKTKEWIPKVPRDLLVIETDCPYLTPQPHRRERNEPSYVAYTCKELASVLKIPVDEVEVLTENNGMRLFSGEKTH